MRKWIGVICVFLGVACIISSIGLVVYNQLEDKKAEGVSQTLLKDVQNILDEKTPENMDKKYLGTKMCPLRYFFWFRNYKNACKKYLTKRFLGF